MKSYIRMENPAATIGCLRAKRVQKYSQDMRSGQYYYVERAIVANKFPGIRASCIESAFAAKMSRTLNDSNVLTMGSMIVSEIMAIKAVEAWLETDFIEGWEDCKELLCNAAYYVAVLDNNLRC